MKFKKVGNEAPNFYTTMEVMPDTYHIRQLVEQTPCHCAVLNPTSPARSQLLCY
jgi:hypothetical protein